MTNLSSNLVNKLRTATGHVRETAWCAEAADELDRQRADIERLNAKLREEQELVEVNLSRMHDRALAYMRECDRLRKALRRITLQKAVVPGLRRELYGHAVAIAHDALASSPVETTAPQQAEIDALRAQIARLEGWEDEKIGAGLADWSRPAYEHDLLVNRVIAECEALRRGVGVSYPDGDDPLRRLKREMPTDEQLHASQRALEQHQRKRAAEKASCDHDWQPVDHYGIPTEFDMCSKCGEDRVRSENGRGEQ